MSPRLMRKPTLVVLLTNLLAAALALTVARVVAAPTAIVTFTGRVIEGPTGVETGITIEGAIVTLRCGNEPYPATGSEVTSDTTDANGFYSLSVDDGIACEYFHIVETDPVNRTSNGATSVDGTVMTPDWIQFDIGEEPLASQDLTGNKFWDSALPAETTCSSCTDCTAKLNGDYTKVQLAQNISVSMAGGSCISVGAPDVTLDGGGHTILNTATGTEMDIGVDVIGHSGVTITNVILDGWSMGVRLSNAGGNRVIATTITAAGTGIYLDRADGNTLAGNEVSESIYAVRLLSADTNAFSDNTFCRQSKRDIDAIDATTGNTQTGTACDIIYNWNGSQTLSSCSTPCTPLYTSGTCGTAAECISMLDGSYGTVSLSGDVSAAAGITIGGNHVTLDCNGHLLTGTGTGAGVSFTDRTGVVVRECTIRGYGTGIELRSSVESFLDTNVIYSNTVGIALLQTDAVIKPQGNTVQGNTVHHNLQYGIQLSSTISNSIASNNAFGNSFYDLWVEGGCRNTITGSGTTYVHDQTGGTITPFAVRLLLLCNVDRALVSGTIDNTWQSVHNDGIVIVDSSGTEVRGASVTAARGIAVIDSDHISVTNSSVISSTGDGISYEGSSYGAVISNSVTLSGGYAVALLSGSGNTRVISNTLGAPKVTSQIAGANAGGILVRDSGGITLQENWVRRNRGNGISLEGASQAAITRNTVRGNGYGLYFGNATSQTTANQNEVCYSSGHDIYSNAGAGATGDNNTCYDPYGWTDTGESSDCTNRCVGWYNRDWGFSFVNPTVDDLSYVRYRQTFGDKETIKTLKVCIGVPVCILWKCWCVGKNVEISTGFADPWAATFYFAAYQNLGEPGTCFGVATQSLRFFYGDDSPANYDPTADEVKDLTANSANGSYDLRVDREIHHGSQLSAEAMGYYLQALASGEADADAVTTAAVTGLENEQMNFVLIKDGVLSGHALNYDSVVAESATVGRIYVYDSNRTRYVTTLVDTPTDYPAIMIGLAANNWAYQMGSETWGSDMIFDMPYSIVNRSDWTLPLSLDGIVNAIFGNSAQAGMTDTEGRLLGYDAAGVAHEDIPGGIGLPVWGAVDASSTGHRLLVQPGDYDIHIFGGDGPYTDTILGLGGGYALEGIPATTATDDLFRFRIVDGDPQHTTLGLATLDAPKPLNLSLIKGWGPEGDNRTYRIFGAVLGPDTLLWAKVLPDLSGVVLANRGTAPFPLALEIRNTLVSAGATYPPDGPILIIEGLSVEPGQTLVVSPDDWGNLTHSEVSLSISTCGDGAANPGEDTVNCPADVAAAPTCVTPQDDLDVMANMLLCPGVYDIADAGNSGVLRVLGSNLTLDCNGATLRGTGAGTGIFVDDTSAITVTRCQVEGYDVGLSIGEVSGASVTESILKMNDIEGLNVSEVMGFYARELYVAENGRGIVIDNAGGVEIVRTALCPNIGTDIETTESSDMTGIDNACDEAINWHDVGVDACTYSCAGPEPGGLAVYLPVLLR